MWIEFIYNYNYEIVLSAHKVGPLSTYNSTTTLTIRETRENKQFNEYNIIYVPKSENYICILTFIRQNKGLVHRR